MAFGVCVQTLTPTNKLKRPVLLAKYINQLKALYAVRRSTSSPDLLLLLLPLLSFRLITVCFFLFLLQALGEPTNPNEKWPGEN